MSKEFKKKMTTRKENTKDTLKSNETSVLFKINTIYHRMLPDILPIASSVVFSSRNLWVQVPPRHGQLLSTPAIIQNKSHILSIHGKYKMLKTYFKIKIRVRLYITLTTNVE